MRMEMTKTSGELEVIVKHISTGKAAKMLSVTPDAVLKWIKKGKIPARRTPGGHYRIPLDAVYRLANGENKASLVNARRIPDMDMTVCF